MGPITALGTESWLINSNSLTNCFFTKNHLSRSHGMHMHENLYSHAVSNKKYKNKNHTLPLNQFPHTHTQKLTRPHKKHTDPLAQLYLLQGQYVDCVSEADYCTVTVKETNVFHRQASISARALLAID